MALVLAEMTRSANLTPEMVTGGTVSGATKRGHLALVHVSGNYVFSHAQYA